MNHEFEKSTNSLTIASRRHQSTISCLPAELLALIFAASTDEEGCLHVQDIVKYSQVSRFWRDVTLRTRSLWMDIDLRWKASEHFAVRSFPLPMNIFLFQPPPYPWEELHALNWLPAHAARVRSISMHTSHIQIHEILGALGPEPQNLLNLNLGSFTVSSFLASRAPNLRRLALYNLSTNLDWYTNLVEISLDLIDCNCCPSAPSAAQLLLLLSRSPCLRILMLDSIVLDIGDNMSLPTVQLSHLSEMRLDCVPIDLTLLILRHLSIPLEALMFSINKLLAVASDIDFSRSINWLELSTQDGTVEFHGSTWDSRIYIKPFHFYNVISLSDIVVHLDLSRTIHLIVKEGDDIYAYKATVDSWKIIFARLPALVTVVLCDRAERLACVMLALFPSNVSDSILCPDLKYLHLDFRYSQWRPDQTLLGRFILDCLRAGIRFGMKPLETLRVDISDDFGFQTTEGIRSLVGKYIYHPCKCSPF